MEKEQIRKEKLFTILIVVNALVILGVIVIGGIFCYDSQTQKKKVADYYFNEGRASLVNELIVEELHNREKITDEQYAVYKNVIINYLDDPTSLEAAEEYKKVVQMLQELMGPEAESLYL